MPFEIERKFLVRGEEYRTIATKKIRIRIKNGRKATLTVKSRTAERRRLELE